MKEIFTSEWFYMFIAVSFFRFSMQIALRDFRGSSTIYPFILSVITFMCSIAAVVFLVFLGIYYTWWTPIIVAVVSVLTSGIISGIIARFIPDVVFGFIGILAVPLLLIFLFLSLPY